MYGNILSEHNPYFNIEVSLFVILDCDVKLDVFIPLLVFEEGE
jgi:hypothetical protein